ncbi:hypothetical protein [uncultured Tateyamaria sp.]|uniref:phage head-tail joining protein n=1 Tax=uncultured Tateyamaria sp. TaxID=455651 RepID=UPI0026306C4C|nr:hypothetical protein [uncultured Tateyamaria sp.]
MSDTATQLATLKSMYAKGVLSLEQNGEKIAFASGAELRRRMGDLETQLAKESGKSVSSGFHYPSYNKGL